MLFRNPSVVTDRALAGRRKRVLLISFCSPPTPPTTAIRASLLARLLPEFGWDATVLTQQRDAPAGNGSDVVLVAVPTPRALSFFAPESRWIPAATARALQLTRQLRFDAIISTCPPACAHIIAGITASCRRLPWIADYREPWCRAGAGNGLRARIEFAIERYLRERAAAITAANADLISMQERMFGRSFGESIPAAEGSAGARSVAQRFAALLDCVTDQGPRILYSSG